jgi:hypothetical protein
MAKIDGILAQNETPKMSDSLIYVKFVKISLGNLEKAQVAIEFTKPLGRVIQE